MFLFMSLLLSYLSFDVPPDNKVWLITREDQGGLYAVAKPFMGEIDEITVSIDDDCDCEEMVDLEEAFAAIFDEVQIIRKNENGGLLLHSALFGEENAPDFFLEEENGRLYYLKKK